MEEKILYTKLPRDKKYRRVTISDAIFSKEDIQRLTNMNTIDVKIPKPNKLYGGTEVYQEEDVPYWYCKIKDGDVFMHLYTEDLTVEDLYYDIRTKMPRIFYTEKQRLFEQNVLSAINNKPSEGYVWIPVYAPSNKDGKFTGDFITIVQDPTLEFKETTEDALKYQPYSMFANVGTWYKTNGEYRPFGFVYKQPECHLNHSIVGISLPELK